MTGIRWRATAAVAAVAAATLSVLLPAVPAQAHTELTTSSPAHRSTITRQIDRVTLTFSGPVKAKVSSVTVIGPDRVAFQTGALSVRDGVVTQPVLPLRSGAYTIAYRVVSGDGHPVTGSVTFTAKLPAEQSPSPSPSPAPAVVVPSASPVPSVDAASAAGPVGESSTGWLWPVGAAALLIAVGGVLVWRRRAS
ncbi:methionine-rich copper-binding protein CopC [Allocatelliglobosispora scoriae]|uniref:Methionine-rich copper-binding protein CopC n=1 Tax=Allocatelliglobosispora scoriae TaxID=643052 RepID=A0A841C5P2_9ACTN|nr:copper resistance CopC family protein [Allocatelliglobosispora scoriae]MBB5874382.1 methionine-rich copper-binding protein CopC [Allocatelliglobosispora scoriae]